MEKSSISKFNTVEEAEFIETVCHFRIRKCIIYLFFKEISFIHFTQMFCRVDEVFFKKVFPKFKFHRGDGENTIYCGKKYCEFILELKEKKMEKFIMIITTTETEEEAQKIAEILVSEKLAACVQIIPSIKSVYTWQGKVEKSNEQLLFIKTKEALFEKVEKTIKENHSYQVPEIVAIPVNNGSRDYLEWLKSVTL